MNLNGTDAGPAKARVLELLAVSLSNSGSTPLRRAIEAYRRMDLSKPQMKRPRAAAVRRIPRLTATQLARLVDRYEAGAMVKDLAAEFGIDRRTVSHHLRQQGVTLRPYPPSDQVIDQMVQLYESGLALTAVAERTGYGTFVVRSALRKRNVSIRPKTRRKRPEE